MDTLLAVIVLVVVCSGAYIAVCASERAVFDASGWGFVSGLGRRTSAWNNR